MTIKLKRRSFIKKSTILTASAVSFPAIITGKEKRKLNVALIGVGGRGHHAIANVKNENVVAICDVDTNVMYTANKKKKTDAPAKLFPNAKKYQDYREMYESQKDIDAVVISTPDHHHYPASIRALNAGIAVYCEKPLTWSAWEAQELARIAEKNKVPTHMGNQGMGGMGWRVAYDYVHSGAIGDIEEVHSFTGSHEGWFSSGIKNPSGEDEIPKTLDWDIWLGPAPKRPYVTRHYHPARWRGWVDFGNGALGDWCCHTMNAYFKIFEPGYPDSVECLHQTEAAIDSYPKGKTVKWNFPAKDGRPAFSSFWYEGTDQMPRPARLEKGREYKHGGSFIVGTKGTVWVVGTHNNSAVLIPESNRKSFGKPKHLAPKPENHPQQFYRAVRGEIPYNAPLSHFGYGGKLTAVSLMGNIAARVKGKLLYNADKMKFTNSEEANKLLSRKPRGNWYI